MAVSADQIQAYATQFLPQFRWEDSERIFPVSVDSWLEQCAEGDWQNATDPHRGTTVVSSAKTLSITSLAPSGGCRGVTAAAGPVGTPLDPTQPLPVPDGFKLAVRSCSSISPAGPVCPGAMGSSLATMSTSGVSSPSTSPCSTGS